MKTAVTTLAGEDLDDKTFAVLYVDDQGDGLSSAENGTLQHKVMKELTLKEQTLQEISSAVDNTQELGILTEAEAKNVMKEGILKLLNNPDFANLIKGAKIILKEREFYMSVPACRINEMAGKEDSVVVQGIVDLCLLTNNGLIIIDYKTGALSSESTINKYKNQIDLYAEAMEKSFKQKVCGKYIASLKTGKLIKV